MSDRSNTVKDGPSQLSDWNAVPLSPEIDADKSVRANFLRTIFPPLQFAGRKLLQSLSFEGRVLFSWQANPKNIQVAKYRVYQQAGNSLELVAETGADRTSIIAGRVIKNRPCSFAVLAVDSDNREGIPAWVTVQ
jgi:hypothetical protein